MGDEIFKFECVDFSLVVMAQEALVQWSVDNYGYVIHSVRSFLKTIWDQGYEVVVYPHLDNNRFIITSFFGEFYVPGSSDVCSDVLLSCGYYFYSPLFQLGGGIQCDDVDVLGSKELGCITRWGGALTKNMARLGMYDIKCIVPVLFSGHITPVGCEDDSFYIVISRIRRDDIFDLDEGNFVSQQVGECQGWDGEEMCYIFKNTYALRLCELDENYHIILVRDVRVTDETYLLEDMNDDDGLAYKFESYNMVMNLRTSYVGKEYGYLRVRLGCGSDILIFSSFLFEYFRCAIV